MVKKKSAQNTTSENSPKKKGPKSLNPWMIATFIAVAILLVLGFNTMTGNSVACPESVSANLAGENLIKFAKAQGAEATLVSVEDDGSFFEVTISLEGQEVPIYVTKDGKNMVPQLIPFDTPTPSPTQNTQTQQQAPAPTTLSESELAEVSVFMECLADAGVKIYGANWCGYTKQIVGNLGGYDVISPIYVECTAEEALCRSEGIQGYPTIKINGEQANVARTLEGFADATGCTAPNVGVQAAASSDVTC